MAEAKGYAPMSADIFAERAAAPRCMSVALQKVEEVVVEVRGPGGVPLRDARVSFTGQERLELLEQKSMRWRSLGFESVPESWHSLDEHGRHVLRGLEKGARVIRVIDVGFAPTEVHCQVPQLQPIIVDLLPVVQGLEVSVQRAKAIAVRALIKVEGVSSSKGIVATEYTDEDGIARFNQLKPGQYRVWAEAEEGQNSEIANVTVADGTPAAVRLRL